ncbi:MAG: hypothetical protein WA081_09815 [Desulfosalsimonadaceae bacterium]
MRAYKLKNLADLRRYLARIVNLLDDDKIGEGKARGLGYLVNILKDVITTGDIETRLEKLESQFKEKETEK